MSCNTDQCGKWNHHAEFKFWLSLFRSLLTIILGKVIKSFSFSHRLNGREDWTVCSLLGNESNSMTNLNFKISWKRNASVRLSCYRIRYCWNDYGDRGRKMDKNSLIFNRGSTNAGEKRKRNRRKEEMSRESPKRIRER